MSKLVELSSGIYVADIKKDYIENIIIQAKQCKHISRVVLFGSSLEERCSDDSDIDIAVFGDISKCKIYNLKSYDEFYNNVVSFNQVNSFQDYDILYFDDRQNNESEIMDNIKNGKVIYIKGD